MSFHGPRRLAREAALQVLYAADLTGEITPEALSATYDEISAEFSLPARARDRARELLHGIAANLGEIDKHIAAASENWKVHRIATVDRNILRIAAYELVWEDHPREVIIDEAVEIARRFAGDTSHAFVNGVLDVLARSAGRSPGEPIASGEEAP